MIVTLLLSDEFVLGIIGDIIGGISVLFGIGVLAMVLSRGSQVVRIIEL